MRFSPIYPWLKLLIALQVYQHHLERKRPDWTWLAKWALMAFVALVVGGLAFLLKQSIDSLFDWKMALARAQFRLEDHHSWARAGAAGGLYPPQPPRLFPWQQTFSFWLGG
jgi:hypothetical protein